MAAQIAAGSITIDNSEYTTWDSCFVQGMYSGALRRMNARARAPLAFGGAVHAGLDKFLVLFSQGGLSFRDIMEQTHTAALADAATSNLDGLGDPARNSRTLVSLLDSYCLEYSRVDSMRFTILSIDGQPAVEQSFVVPLGKFACITSTWGAQEINVNWSGKIDIISKYDNAICPVDHKTTSVMGEKFIDDKVRGSQMLGYTYASRYLSHRLFNDLPVFGVRINALAMRKGGYEFKLFDIPFPDWKVGEWQSETLLSIQNLVEQLDKFLVRGEAVPTREHCVTKYGKCQFFDVCDTPATMRDRILFDDSYFFKSDWSPLNT